MAADLTAEPTAGLAPDSGPDGRVTAPPATIGPLRRRAAGQAVMEQVLTLQAAAPPRSFLGRMFGVPLLPASSRSWYAGALGERLVGRVLATLGSEWTVLHAVPVGTRSSDIDHVVIGPAGVFTINTKHHAGARIWTARGTFMVNGTRVPYLRNSAHEAARAAKLLSAAVRHDVTAEALIVIVGSRELTRREKHETVSVLTHTEVFRWLGRRPAVFSPDQVDLLSAAAAQPGTWTRTAPILQNPADVVGHFDALVRAVEQARRRRIGWLLAAPAAFLASAAHIFPPL